MFIKRNLAILSALLFAVALAISAAPAQAQRPSGIFCSSNYIPVCGLKNGQRTTYTNSCWAHRAGAKILHNGECFGPICIFFLPVCARSPRGYPQTYPSLCTAENDNAVFLKNGDCK